MTWPWWHPTWEDKLGSWAPNQVSKSTTDKLLGNCGNTAVQFVPQGNGCKLPCDCDGNASQRLWGCQIHCRHRIENCPMARIMALLPLLWPCPQISRHTTERCDSCSVSLLAGVCNILREERRVFNFWWNHLPQWDWFLALCCRFPLWMTASQGQLTLAFPRSPSRKWSPHNCCSFCVLLNFCEMGWLVH